MSKLRNYHFFFGCLRIAECAAVPNQSYTTTDVLDASVCVCVFFCVKENPAYGRHRISRPKRIVGPIQFWRVCVIYLERKKIKKNGSVDVSTRPRVHASTRPRNGSTRGPWTLCTHPPFWGLHTCNKMGSSLVIRWAPHQFFHAKSGKISKKLKKIMRRF